MVDDRPEETGSLPDQERPKRAPPTIDLEATDVSTAAPPADGAAKSESTAESAAEPASEPPATPPAAAPISPWIIAPVSGAVAAALVIGVGWMLGWPPVQPASAPQPNATIDGLTARIAGLESKSGKAVADP